MVCGKYHGITDVPITDKEGQFLTSEAEEADCHQQWKPTYKRWGSTSSVNIDPPEKEDIIFSCQNPCEQKSPWPAQHQFRADPELVAKMLQPLFAAMWEERKVSDWWTDIIIIKIPKKGTKSNYYN